MDDTSKTSVISISITELSFDELRTEYYTIKNLLGNVQSELEQKSQELYDCKRLLKTAEALEKDYQQEIEALQKSDNEELLKLKSIVQKLEANLAESQQFHNEHIQFLESELAVKSEEIKELQDELTAITANIEKKAIDNTEALQDEIDELKSEIETLNELNEGLQEQNDDLKSQNFMLEEQIVALKTEVENLNEIVNSKREELAEANEMISTLQDEMAALKNEMDALQRKPLEKDSKGNSLFAEVDDRRVELQNTIKNMKTKYVEMRKEFSNLLKQVSSLRTENVKMRERWEADLSETASDEQYLLNSFKSRVEALEIMVKSYQSELAEQKKYNSDSSRDFGFLENLLEKRVKEIETLRQELGSQSVNNNLLSDELKSANAQIRKLKLEKICIEQELNKIKGDAELMQIESVFTKLLNTECYEEKSFIQDETLPISACSQNIDFSHLEKGKRSRSINMSGVIKNIFDEDNKENANASNLTMDVLKSEVNRSIISNEINSTNVDLPNKKVMFLENQESERSGVLRKNTKIIKSNPIVFSHKK